MPFEQSLHSTDRRKNTKGNALIFLFRIRDIHPTPLHRYKTSLASVPTIGLKKGLVQGLCQIFSNVAIGIVFTAALWYGQYLIKTECRAYSAGRLVVVSDERADWNSLRWTHVDLYCLFEHNLVSQSVGTEFREVCRCHSGGLLCLCPDLSGEFMPMEKFILLFWIQTSKIDASKPDQGKKLATFDSEIKFDNVTFTYPTRPTETVCTHLLLINRIISIAICSMLDSSQHSFHYPPW